MYYDIVYYEDEELNNANFVQFKTKKQALAFYNKHKNDGDKFGWWITKRNEDDEILEDIIY